MAGVAFVGGHGRCVRSQRHADLRQRIVCAFFGVVAAGPSEVLFCTWIAGFGEVVAGGDHHLELRGDVLCPAAPGR